MPTNPSQCSRNTKQHSKKVRVPHTQPAHTNQQTTIRFAGQQTNQHTTMHTKNKKYIGTLLSSHTSSAHHKKINQTLTSRKRPEQAYPTNPHKSKPTQQAAKQTVQHLPPVNLPATSRRLELIYAHPQQTTNPQYNRGVGPGRRRQAMPFSALLFSRAFLLGCAR